MNNMDEIVKHINDTNASYRTPNAGDAKNTDLFLDNEHFELFRGAGEQITVRYSKENLSKAILFIASILPRKYDNSSIHKSISYSTEFVYDQLAFLDFFFKENGAAVVSKTQNWYLRKDVPKKNGDIDNRFYFNGLLEEVAYVNSKGEHTSAKFTIRNYLAGGYSDLHIKKADDGIYDVWITNTQQPFFDDKEEGLEFQEKRLPEVLAFQQIFYGAPGTGKSYYIEKVTKGENVERTTFHPDSDYSTFVGAYKPTTIDVPMRDVTGKIIVEGGVKVTEKRIVYNFIPQAFLKAYTGAWKNQEKPFYLIIEEINRGNCAQIFGDLFQLLDRNEEGESDYPISPDTDIQNFLLTDSEYGFAALTEEQTNAIPENVRNGKVLILPHNLFIWATMNTSDQSLFPIDSAFKRRWDWQYVPISDAQKNWQIEVQGNRYDWWEFLQKINDKIGVATNSEDKKLGYFFCKANNDGIINAETFVGKVIFYIWNDVFKDFADEAGDLFKDEEGNPLSFGKFYTAGTDGKAKVLEDKVALFLEHLGVGFVNIDDDEEEIADEVANAHRKASIISIQIPSNPTIFTKDSSVIEAFVKALSQIGIERIIPVIGNLKYKRLNCPVLSTEKYPPIEKDVAYSYVQKDNLYIVKGCKQYTYIRILEDLDKLLNIGLSLETK